MNPRKSNAASSPTVPGDNRAGRGNPGTRPGGPPLPPRPTATAQLDLLADGIEKWRIEFERFLSGTVVVPPDDHRARLLRDLRELRNANLKTSADQFRLASLEARFNSYSELFNRRQREREEGRSARPARSSAPPEERRLDASAGVVITDRLEPEAVDALYRNLTERSAPAGGPPAMELATFRGYLSQQIESIRLKTGCEAVQFRIAAENGKLKLKAKPVGK